MSDQDNQNNDRYELDLQAGIFQICMTMFMQQKDRLGKEGAVQLVFGALNSVKELFEVGFLNAEHPNESNITNIENEGN